MSPFPAGNERILTRAPLVALAAIVAYLAVSSASLDSATDDEPVHITAGYIKWETGDFDYYREAPPLMNFLVALPLRIGKVDFPPVWKTIPNEWDAGHELLHWTGHDADALLFLCRAPVILLFLLLCFLVYLWVFTVTGDRWFSLMGFAFTGFCPNLLAHGRLATSDMGITFFLALTAFLFFRFLYAPGWTNTVLAGVSASLAILSKVSGLILLVYLPVLTASFMVLENRTSRKYVFRYVSRFAVMMLVSLSCIEAFYLAGMGDSYILAHYPEAAGSILHRLPVPLEEYGRNVSSVSRWVSESYNKPQFLLGSFSLTGWWYYYPVAFLLKTPVPVILLFIGSILYAASISPKCRRSPDPGEKRHFSHLLGVSLFIFLFFTVSCTSKLNIGIRYILPVYPFVIVFIAISVSRFYRSLAKPGIAPYIPLLALVAWTVVSGAAAHPSYLSYFNEIVRSEVDKDRYLIDSNLDWGQDLKRLAIWVGKNRVPEIHIAYFGGGEPAYYLGSKAVPFPPERRKGYYAISRHIYRTSSFFRDSLREDFEGFFRNARHVTTIGGSIYVFEME